MDTYFYQAGQFTLVVGGKNREEADAAAVRLARGKEIVFEKVIKKSK